MFSWTLCFITNEKGAESSKILNLFIHAPLLTRDDDRCYFPALVGSQRPLWGTLVRLPRPLSLMVPYSRRVMIVLRRSLYGVVSDGRFMGLFVPLPPAVLTGFPREQALYWRQVWPNFVSQCCADPVSLTVTKHHDICSTFYKADVNTRGLSSHFVSWF